MLLEYCDVNKNQAMIKALKFLPTKSATDEGADEPVPAKLSPEAAGSPANNLYCKVKFIAILELK